MNTCLNIYDLLTFAEVAEMTLGFYTPNILELISPANESFFWVSQSNDPLTFCLFEEPNV